MPRSRLPGSSSGTCASIRSQISGPTPRLFNAFRGTAWMKEPCASCPRRELDFGGCRCQAFALTGDVSATDPVCHLAPDHARVAKLAAVRTDAPYIYRRMGSPHRADVLDGDDALSRRRRS